MSDKKEDNLVAGLSMGGYGAWKLALGTSGMFGAGASLSGALDVVRLYETRGSESLMTDVEFHGIFGNIERLKGSDDDLSALLRKKVENGEELPKLYGWCGISDNLYPMNKKIWKEAEALGYDLTWEESEGDHHWKYWDDKIKNILSWWLGEEIDS